MENLVINQIKRRGRIHIKITFIQEHMTIQVFEITNLQINENIANSKIYVEMKLIPNAIDSIRRTSYHESTSNSNLNEALYYDLLPGDSRKRLLISVYQKSNRELKDIFLGCFSFKMKSLLTKDEHGQSKVTENWYSLLCEKLGLRKHVVLQSNRGNQSTPFTPDVVKAEPMKKTLSPKHSILNIFLHMRSNGFGFTIRGSNPVKISNIKPGSSAEIAGLRIGDVINKIDGNDVSTLAAELVADIIRQANQLIVIQVARKVNDHLLNTSLPNTPLTNFTQTQLSLFTNDDQNTLLKKHIHSRKSLKRYSCQFSKFKLNSQTSSTNFKTIKSFISQKTKLFQQKKFKSRSNTTQTTCFTEGDRNIMQDLPDNFSSINSNLNSRIVNLNGEKISVHDSEINICEEKYNINEKQYEEINQSIFLKEKITTYQVEADFHRSNSIDTKTDFNLYKRDINNFRKRTCIKSSLQTTINSKMNLNANTNFINFEKSCSDSTKINQISYMETSNDFILKKHDIAFLEESVNSVENSYLSFDENTSRQKIISEYHIKDRPSLYQTKDRLTFKSKFSNSDEENKENNRNTTYLKCNTPNIFNFSIIPRQPMNVSDNLNFQYDTTGMSTWIEEDSLFYEMLSLEEEFLNTLRHGIHKYVRPFRHGFLSRSQHSILFQNIEKILTISEFNLKSLSTLINNEEFNSRNTDEKLIRVCQHFTLKLPMIFESLEQYSIGFKTSHSLLKTLRNSNNEFLVFLKNINVPINAIETFIKYPKKYLKDLNKKLRVLLSYISEESNEFTSIKQIVAELSRILHNKTQPTIYGVTIKSRSKNMHNRRLLTLQKLERVASLTQNLIANV